MMRLLVSVRSVDEAMQAAAAGADLIDLKEPRDGALGALPRARIERIVASLRERHPHLPLSATTGDLHAAAEADVVAAVATVAECGVDYVKVGVPRGRSTPSLVRRLAALRVPVVPVLLCDEGLDVAALGAVCSAPFPAVMADTVDKRSGSLFDCVDARALAMLVDAARASGKLAGLSGSLGIDHVAQLAALAPDFAGFRGAVCSGDRTGDLDPRKVRGLRAALHAAQSGVADVASSSQ